MNEISTLISQDLFSKPGLSPASGGCRLLRPTQTGDRAEVELAFLYYLRIQLKEVKGLNLKTELFFSGPVKYLWNSSREDAQGERCVLLKRTIFCVSNKQINP